jgi:hypothetical protein
MDYLREYIAEHPDHPPFENVIIFDEAQRAWDAAYGKQKFEREASEPALSIRPIRIRVSSTRSSICTWLYR